jgi:tetratricopeptide (TPR) repeat protein
VGSKTKSPKGGDTTDEKRRSNGERGWERHLDGWQAGLVLVVIVASAVVIGIPRAAVPEHTPSPVVDYAALTQVMDTDDARARRAETEQLDVDVRAVGREMRAYNELVAAGERDELAEARAKLIRAVKNAVEVDEEGLAALRAYQLARFLLELRAWQKTGEISEELTAVSGDFVRSLAAHRWCREGRELVMDERVLRVLYKKRWTELAGLRGPLFDLTLDEDRLRYGFLLRHPFVPTAGRNMASLEPGSALDRVRRGEARLKVLERLAERDESYPAELARGVILFRMNRYAVAAEAFRNHLDAAPDGPNTLLARNYLKASLDRADMPSL